MHQVRPFGYKTLHAVYFIASLIQNLNNRLSNFVVRVIELRILTGEKAVKLVKINRIIRYVNLTTRKKNFLRESD